MARSPENPGEQLIRGANEAISEATAKLQQQADARVAQLQQQAQESTQRVGK
ncbi:hypothetical protein KC921_00045 [Candidatus Woesebacteria bacterium]|nr:hypothetical protein [Candidatus Woesebacteria bacterium]